MDSDDTIPEECGRRLREMADGNHPSVHFGLCDAGALPRHNPDDPRDLTIVDHVKLFRL